MLWVHEHGHVVLDDHMGDDLAIVNNARVSFNEQGETMDERNAGLIGFLMRNRHGSPFEAVTFRFDVKAPLFVFREWHRHRIGHSYNEWSARYSVIEPEFYVPQRDYIRHQVGKPGAYTFERLEDDELAAEVAARILQSQRDSYDDYEEMISEGVAKEVARVVLPVGTYSRMKWTCNLRSLMHFLSLRNSEHAQREIRDYAIAVEYFASSICPVAMQSFIENGRTAP
jgi:thymidylate synthase (FAD)